MKIISWGPAVRGPRNLNPHYLPLDQPRHVTVRDLLFMLSSGTQDPDAADYLRWLANSEPLGIISSN